MRITRANVDELNNVLTDLVEDTGSAIRDAAETWLDEENDRDERSDAREVLETELDNLREQVESLAKLLGS